MASAGANRSISKRQLLARRVTLQRLHQLALSPHQSIDGLDHVHGDADGARLVGDRPADGLAYPPGGVGAEFEASRGVELLHGSQQAEIALLNQVQEGNPPADVALGHADHQPQVSADERLVRLLSPRFHKLQLGIEELPEGDRGGGRRARSQPCSVLLAGSVLRRRRLASSLRPTPSGRR